MKKLITMLALLCLLPLALGQTLSPETTSWHNDEGNDSCITFYSDQAIYSIKAENPELKQVIALAENNCGNPITGNLGIFFEQKDIQETEVKELYQSTSSHVEIVGKTWECLHQAIFDEKTNIGTCYYNDINGMNILFRQEVKALNGKVFSWDEEKTVNDFYLVQKRYAPSIAPTGKIGFELSESTGNIIIPTGISYLRFSASLPKGSRQGFFIITFENNSKKEEKTVLDPEYRVGVFDTFEDNDYTLNPVWTHASGTGTVAVTAASKKNGTYGLEMSNIAADNVNMETPINVATLDTWTWIKVANITALLASHSYLDAAKGYISILTIRSSKFAWYDSTGYHDFTAIPVNNTWYILRTQYDGSDLNYYVYDSSLALIESQLNKIPANTGNVGYIRLFGQNMAGSIYYDDIGYGDSTIPGAGPPPNSSPDVNITAIESFTEAVAFPIFSYARDGNLTIDFNVFDIENDRLTVDINYHTSAEQGTGTAIYTDLNLDTQFCTSPDWNKIAVACSIDFNISGIGDNNFYVKMEVKDFNGDFNSSWRPFGIDNNAPVYISISPFGDSFLFQDEANFWLHASDSFSGLHNCNYTSYFNGVPGVNKTVDFNASGFCPVTELLGESGSSAFVRYYSISDHAGNIALAIHDTGALTRAFSQSVDPENILELDIGKALTFFSFSLLQAIGLAAVLILVFLLVRAILFR